MVAFVLGIVAALTAPFLSVLGCLIWDNHWIGGSPFALNLFKCNLAALAFAVVCGSLHQLTTEVIPVSVLVALMISSTLGILLGDWAWLEALRILGVSKVTVLDCLKPFLAAFLGNIFLGERLPVAALGGIVLTVAGVALVGLEQQRQQQNQEEPILSDTADASTEPATVETTAPYTLAQPRQFSEDSLFLDPHTSLFDSATEHHHLLQEFTPCDIARGNRARNQMEEKQQSYFDARVQNQKLLLPRELAYGIFIGLLNVLFHTAGALLTKSFAAALSTWQINLIRFGFSGLVMLLISIMAHFSVWWVQTTKRRNVSMDQILHENNDATAAAAVSTTPWYALPSRNNLSLDDWMRVSLGVACVTVLGPALNNYAMFQISFALLLTLESIGPLYSLPLSWLMQGTRPTCKACLGATLAVAGIALLALSW